MYKGHKGGGGGGGGVKEIIDYHGLLVDYWNFIQLLRTNMSTGCNILN